MNQYAVDPGSKLGKTYETSETHFHLHIYSLVCYPVHCSHVVWCPLFVLLYHFQKNLQKQKIIFCESKSTSKLFRAVRKQQLHFSIFWKAGIWNMNKQNQTAGRLTWRTAHISMCTQHLQLIRSPRLAHLIFTVDE